MLDQVTKSDAKKTLEDLEELIEQVRKRRVEIRKVRIKASREQSAVKQVIRRETDDK